MLILLHTESKIIKLYGYTIASEENKLTHGKQFIIYIACELGISFEEYIQK